MKPPPPCSVLDKRVIWAPCLTTPRAGPGSPPSTDEPVNPFAFKSQAVSARAVAGARQRQQTNGKGGSSVASPAGRLLCRRRRGRLACQAGRSAASPPTPHHPSRGGGGRRTPQRPLSAAVGMGRERRSEARPLPAPQKDLLRPNGSGSLSGGWERSCGCMKNATLVPLLLSCCLCCCRRRSCQHICSPRPPRRAPTASSPPTATIRRTHASVASALCGSPSNVHLSVNSAGRTPGQGRDGTALRATYWWSPEQRWDPNK